tara:strand:+ start:18551 stop:19447 length:897 start_codon:yes stop_codon:yes gene_type:complete
MTTNLYFTQGRKSEQDLYEDLIIESMQIYGQDVYYMPRELVNKDTIFQDDNVSRFDNAYKLEMYIENTDGFDGEGDLFTKFGVEIRDAATFIVSRRRWGNKVAQFESSATKPFYRPREGDLIFLPLSKTFFEITGVDTESPFYQIKDLPVFKMRAEMFTYNDEDFDTGVESIDIIEANQAYQTILTMASITGTFEIGELIEQVHNDDTGIRSTGEIVNIDLSENKLYIAHTGGMSDGSYRVWDTGVAILGLTSGATGDPSAVENDLGAEANNDDFNTTSQGGTIDFIDFSDSNPFGDL